MKQHFPGVWDIGVEIWFKHRGFNEPPWENTLKVSDSHPTPQTGGSSPISPLSAASVLPFSFSLTCQAVWQGWRREGAALCVRQINLLSVSGPICHEDRVHLVATQPSKSNQIEISLEMFEQLLVHERLSCWAELHLCCRASSEISCLTLFPSRRCLICTSLLQPGIIKMSAKEAPRVFRLTCLVNLT